jgi:hypothetical protein
MDLDAPGLVTPLPRYDAIIVQHEQLPQQPHSRRLVRAHGYADRWRSDKVDSRWVGAQPPQQGAHHIQGQI